MRRYNLIGEINEESFKEFCEQMDVFEEEIENTGDSPEIELILNSEGGNALDAIAFCGRIRTSPCDITVKVMGLAGSAAVLVLAAGDHRCITRESWVYVHEDSDTFKGIETSDLEKQAKTARVFEDHWSTMLEELTHTGAERWTDLHKADLYLTPKHCLELGLVDEIM